MKRSLSFVEESDIEGPQYENIEGNECFLTNRDVRLFEIKKEFKGNPIPEFIITDELSLDSYDCISHWCSTKILFGIINKKNSIVCFSTVFYETGCSDRTYKFFYKCDRKKRMRNV